jgi:hypothetical protein
MSNGTGHVYELDVLRALSATSVVWFIRTLDVMPIIIFG